MTRSDSIKSCIAGLKKCSRGTTYPGGESYIKVDDELEKQLLVTLKKVLSEEVK